jgi:hypothetical protein
MLYPEDSAIVDWLAAALPAARQCVSDPENEQWWRHGNTWFVGVNALNNDSSGAVPGGPALAGIARQCIDALPGFSGLALDRAQVSVCLPGYPGRDAGESETGYRYRRNRDAAHIDGLLRHGPDRRRYLGENHAYILGIPMVPWDPGAAPFVVWEGSHLLARETFEKLFAGIAADRWQSLDLTDAYHDLRRRIFARCRRCVVHAEPGQVYLVHRMALHGMAPWESGARAGPDGRMICYFRPPFSDPVDWLRLP